MVRLCQPLNEEVNVMNNKNNLSERKKRKCVLNLLMRLSTAFIVVAALVVVCGGCTGHSSWGTYVIEDALSIKVPPTLELRSDEDVYTEFLKDNLAYVNNSSVIFQQKELSEINRESMKTYCRIMVTHYNLETGDVPHCDDVQKLSPTDYDELRSIADAQLGPFGYVETPSYKNIDANGSVAIDISYVREGLNGDVRCHIYILSNYDEMAMIVTSYRVSEASKWAQDVEDVIDTFEWTNPH